MGNKMNALLFYLCIAVAGILAILMLYAAYWKRYDRVVLLGLLAFAAVQFGQAVTAHYRGYTTLMWLYVIAGIGMPVMGLFWIRRMVKERENRPRP